MSLACVQQVPLGILVLPNFFGMFASYLCDLDPNDWGFPWACMQHVADDLLRCVQRMKLEVLCPCSNTSRMLSIPLLITVVAQLQTLPTTCGQSCPAVAALTYQNACGEGVVLLQALPVRGRSHLLVIRLSAGIPACLLACLLAAAKV